MSAQRQYSHDELEGLEARFVSHEGKDYAIVENDGLFSHFEIDDDGFAYWLGASKQFETPWDFLDGISDMFRNALRPGYH